MTKKTELAPLSEAQMEIMQCIWELGEVGVIPLGPRFMRRFAGVQCFLLRKFVVGSV